MIENIENIFSKNGYSIQEAQVFAESGITYWHSNILDKELKSLSAGFGKNRTNARKIAIAEYLERTTYRKIASLDKNSVPWGLNIIPTACGFAAGFDLNNTIARSVAESAERWVMSKWIDDQYHIEQLDSGLVTQSLDPISKFFVAQFEKILFFSKDVLIDLGGSFFKVSVAQTMAFKDGGIYPGSSGQLTGGSVWQHALLESFRHLLVVKNNPVQENVFPDNKIRFFAKNADLAIEQINKAHKKDWPLPNVILHKSDSFDNDQYFIARTILDGWKSWHEGPIERFLY